MTASICPRCARLDDVEVLRCPCNTPQDMFAIRRRHHEAVERAASSDRIVRYRQHDRIVRYRQQRSS